MKQSLVFFLLTIFASAGRAQENSSIKFEQWLSLKSAGAPTLSPDGKDIAYPITVTDWKNNGYHSEIWLSHAGATPFQLTQTQKGNSFSAQFTPDSKWLSFLADRGDKTQLYIISPNGGEAIQVTHEEDGIDAYAWSPDGKKIALTKADADSKKEKATKEHYGAFDVEDQGYKFNHLWLISFNYDSLMMAAEMPCAIYKGDSAHLARPAGCSNFAKAVRLTSGNFTVSNFNWNPDSRTIALTIQPDGRVKSGSKSDIAILDLASRKLTTLIANPGGDSFNEWAPDGKQFIYTSSLGDTVANFYKNNRVFIYDLASHTSKELAADFDENKNIIDWNPKGIYFGASIRTKSLIYRIDPNSLVINPVNIDADITSWVSFSKNGQMAAVASRSYNGLSEVSLLKSDGSMQSITHMSKQVSTWNTPINEIINWKSQDGATIEGILLKPRNYDPAKKYPLLVVIHGGPTGVDRPEPTPSYVYPMMQWVEKGALILRVNYRGSAAYGAAFRALNVRNLGVGDMWDVMSGVKYLSKKGIIDTNRMGCMGWSQGGYISAFLTTNTHAFKAISVGAGISDWATYYVSTDITPFTTQYLKATP